MKKQDPKPAKPAEFSRFEELTRKLVSVPKSEIEKQKDRYEREKEKRPANG